MPDRFTDVRKVTYALGDIQITAHEEGQHDTVVKLTFQDGHQPILTTTLFHLERLVTAIRSDHPN